MMPGMLRTTALGMVLSFGLLMPGGAGLSAQSGLGSSQVAPASTTARPPAEISFSRLKPDTTVAIVLEPGAVASDDAVWVPGRAPGTVVRIEATGNAVGKPIAVGSQPCAALVVAFDSLWVPLCGDQGIARVDQKEQKVTATAKVAVANAEGRIASTVGSIWAVTERKGVLSRIDPDSGASVAEIYVAGGAAAVEAGKDALWITSEESGRLTRVNPHNNEVVAEVTVGPKPVRLAVGEGGVWTLNGDGTVTRVDPETNKVVATISVGGDTAKGDISAGAGSVWISTPGAPIIRIDPRTNRAVQRFTGEGGGAILVAHGSVWVAAGPQATWRLDPRLVAAMRP
jgi:streptogramin lyase